MSTNKDLASQLTEMRLKAKQAATTKPEIKPDNGEAASDIKPKPNIPKLTTSKKPKSQTAKEGRGETKTADPTLERTTITLKTGDNAALSNIQSFLMKRERRAAPTSTLIRLALFYTKQALSSDGETIAKAYQQILEEDGRRKPANV